MINTTVTQPDRMPQLMRQSLRVEKSSRQRGQSSTTLQTHDEIIPWDRVKVCAKCNLAKAAATLCWVCMMIGKNHIAKGKFSRPFISRPKEGVLDVVKGPTYLDR